MTPSLTQFEILFFLDSLPAPEIVIIDEQGTPLFEKYYEVDSTIELMCVVRYITMTQAVVYWTHNDHMLNYDATRGGIR